MLWNLLQLQLSKWSDFVLSASLGQVLLVVTTAVLLNSVFGKGNKTNIYNAPIHYASRLEPKFLSHLKFVLGAKDRIASGYKKYKDKIFVVRRLDADYNVLPIKHLGEIRNISPSVLNGRIVLLENLLYQWTNLDFLRNSSLHIQVLQRKLTPELPRFLKSANRELEYGWGIEVPKPDDWLEVEIQNIMRKLVARMSASVFVGEPACRDPKWIDVAVNYTIDLFATAMLLRVFPTWMRPVVALVLPSRYRLARCRAKAEQVIRDTMEKRVKAAQVEHDGQAPDASEDKLLNWMMDHGTEEETKIPEMANRQCVLTFASVHNTAQTTATVLFELCEHPEWVPVLREEIDQVNQQMGRGTALDLLQWHKKLEKMDSFLLECFRLHQPIMLLPQRMALSEFTLKDGTRVPKGCRITFACAEHLMDPAVNPDPLAFDPMRCYRKRYASPDQHDRHQAVVLDADENLAFGYGTQACPGRFFGVAEIKMLMARLLTEFDFKYPEGKSMPRTIGVDENSFLHPSATLMMRKRKSSKA